MQSFIVEDKVFNLLLSICHLQKLEFHGVMRFYYQNPDPGSGQKVRIK